MGPLDNLVGLQYRIDHLENLKADIFDMIAFPMPKIKGYVEEFKFGPGESIICGDEGDVTFLHPDTTALNADNQIAIYEQRMEEAAGAPKQTMGFRTPGEKTAYEVQSLENASGRIFVNKTSHFEETFIEPVINDMLELSRRNIQQAESIKVLNDRYSADVFRQITKEDITATGKIRPRGASVYVRRNVLTQNLSNFLNSAFAQDEAVKAHISTIQAAKAFAELLGLQDYNLIKQNVRLVEMADMEAEKRELQTQLQQEASLGDGTSPGGPNGIGNVNPDALLQEVEGAMQQPTE